MPTTTPLHREIPYSPLAAGGNDKSKKSCKIRSIALAFRGKQTLDVFAPKNPVGRCPVLIHVHGGGWQRGSKDSEWRGGPVVGRWAADNGMVSAVVGYRLAPASPWALLLRTLILSLLLSGLLALIPSSIKDIQFYYTFPVAFAAWGLVLSCIRCLKPKVRHPDQVMDVAQAVVWVRQNIQNLYPEADPTRIFISGHSAGAHLISLAALDTTYLKQNGLADLSCIKGVVSVSGVYSLVGPLSDRRYSIRNMFFRLVYAASAFGFDRKVWEDASPINHVREDAPPFIVLSATQDLGLQVDAARMVAALKAAGVYTEHHTIPNTSHASIASRFDRHEAQEHVLRFIRKMDPGPDESRPVLDQPSM